MRGALQTLVLAIVQIWLCACATSSPHPYSRITEHAESCLIESLIPAMESRDTGWVEVSPNEFLIEVNERTGGDRSYIIELRDCSDITVYETTGMKWENERLDAWRQARFGEEYCQQHNDWMETLSSASQHGLPGEICYKSEDISTVLIWFGDSEPASGTLELYRFPETQSICSIPLKVSKLHKLVYTWARLGKHNAVVLISPFSWNKDEFWTDVSTDFYAVSLSDSDHNVERYHQKGIPKYWDFLTADPDSMTAIIASEVIIFWRTYYLLDIRDGTKKRLFRTGRFWSVTHPCPMEDYCDLVHSARFVDLRN